MSRIVDPSIPDETTDPALRPRTFDEYVGQAQVVDNNFLSDPAQGPCFLCLFL